MKRLLLVAIGLFFLAFLSCRDDETVVSITDETTEGEIHELSAQQAEKILTNFIERQNYLPVKTRSNNVIIKGFTKEYCSPLSTRSTEGSSGKVAFYNFEMESSDGECFAIVCADKRLPQVIAYSKKGSLEDVRNSGNTFLNNYLANLPDAVSLLIENRMSLPDMSNRYVGGFPYEDMPDVAHSWETDSTRERVVFLHEAITWEQSAPYNYKMPIDASGKHYVVGCSNIACANIMGYYCYPERYNWAALEEFRVIIEGYQPDAVVMEAAQLCKDIFDANKSIPHDKGTETNPINVIAGLKSFGYESSNLINYNLDSIKYSLEHFYPIYMRGQNPEKTVGHAFVVRGYWDIVPKNPMGYLSPSTTIGINWGWMGGFGDGFYLVEYDGFDLAYLGLYPLLFTDDGPKYSTSTYSDKVKLITRIRPKGY